MTTAEIGGLVFQGNQASAGLHLRRLIDWDSLSEVKSEPDSRPQAHGTFRHPENFREGPVISIEGWYRGSSRADALMTRRNIAGALAGNDLRLTVIDELGPTSRDVSARAVSFGDLFGNFFDFAIDMTASDPRRYGPSTAEVTGPPTSGGGLTWPVTWPITWTPGGANGRITISNPGTADTFPLFEVTGGLEFGFSITEIGTGREIRFERFIPSGSTVFLNPRTGAAWIDAAGNDVSGYLTRSDWFSVPDNAFSVIQFVPLGGTVGTPTLTARTAPAYW